MEAVILKVMLWCHLAMLALAGVVAAIASKKREEKNKNNEREINYDI
jgi:hypothetical protein